MICELYTTFGNKISNAFESIWKYCVCVWVFAHHPSLTIKTDRQTFEKFIAFDHFVPVLFLTWFAILCAPLYTCARVCVCSRTMARGNGKVFPLLVKIQAYFNIEPPVIRWFILVSDLFIRCKYKDLSFAPCVPQSIARQQLQTVCSGCVQYF